MAHRRARFLTTLLRQCTTLQQTTRSVSTLEFPVARDVVKRIDAQRRFDSRTASFAAPEPEILAPFFFKVRIITGNVRGAGTNASIRLQLIGTRGDSDPVVVSKESGFPQGSVITTVLPVEKDIGNLRMVVVERDTADGSLADESWYLEKLLVEDHKGHQLCFPCAQWLGVSACGQITSM